MLGDSQGKQFNYYNMTLSFDIQYILALCPKKYVCFRSTNDPKIFPPTLKKIMPIYFWLNINYRDTMYHRTPGYSVQRNEENSNWKPSLLLKSETNTETETNFRILPI
jgi:hypothetical protein